MRRKPEVTKLNSGLARPEVTDAEIWISTGSSLVTLVGPVDITSIDASVTPGPMGRTAPNVIRAYAGEGCLLRGEYELPSGGRLVMLE